MASLNFFHKSKDNKTNKVDGRFAGPTRKGNVIAVDFSRKVEGRVAVAA